MLDIDDIISIAWKIAEVVFWAFFYVLIFAYSPAMLLRRIVSGKWGLRGFDDSIAAQFLWGILGTLSWAVVIYVIVMIIS